MYVVAHNNNKNNTNSTLYIYSYSNALFANSKDYKLTLGYLFKLARGTIYYKLVK